MGDAGGTPNTTSATILMWLTYAAGVVGLAVAGGPGAEGSLEVVALTVGAVGVLSFVRHSIFHRADAARMGWEGAYPGFQIEVGFANLAIGLAAIASAAWAWGPAAQGALVLAYGLYILQAAIVHAVHAARGAENRRHEAIVAAASLALAVVLGWYAVAGMGTAGIPPF